MKVNILVPNDFQINDVEIISDWVSMETKHIHKRVMGLDGATQQPVLNLNKEGAVDLDLKSIQTIDSAFHDSIMGFRFKNKLVVDYYYDEEQQSLKLCYDNMTYEYTHDRIDIFSCLLNKIVAEFTYENKVINLIIRYPESLLSEDQQYHFNTLIDLCNLKSVVNELYVLTNSVIVQNSIEHVNKTYSIWTNLNTIENNINNENDSLFVEINI